MTTQELTNNEIPAETAETIQQAEHEAAEVEAVNGIHSFFRGGRHYGKDGKNGVRHLIKTILTEAGSGLTTAEIIQAARSRGFTHKYPNHTFSQTLANVLAPAGEIRMAKVARRGRVGRPGYVWELAPVANPENPGFEYTIEPEQELDYVV